MLSRSQISYNDSHKLLHAQFTHVQNYIDIYTRLWNSLPPININLSISTISSQLILLTLGAHAHSEGYSSCRVCMCVCVTTHNCRLAHWNHKTKIPTSS